MVNSSTSSGKIAFNSIIYTFSGLLMKCFSLFLLPLYTSYLSTSDYGIVNIANSFIHTMSFIVAFSLYSAIMRFYVDYKQDENKLKQFYGTVISFVFISCITFGGVCFLGSGFLSKYVFGGMNFYPIIFVSLISLLFTCQHTIYDNILKSQQKAMKSSILSLIYFFVSVGLNILFVVVFDIGALGVLLTSVIATGLYTLYFIVDMIVSHEITFCLNFSLLKSALKYSIPIMPHNLSTAITVFFSNLLISNTNSLAALGVYSVATQFGNMSDTVQVYVNNAYGPWLYEKLKAKEEGFKQSIRNISSVLVSVIGLFFIGISLFAHDYIVLFVDEAYVDAWKYVVLIVMVFAIKIPYYFYVNILFYYKEASRLLFTATLTSSFINVILSSLLIPLLGVYGSILADALSMLVRVLIIYIISTKYENIGLRFFDFIKSILKIVIFIMLGLIFSFTKYSNVFSVWNFLYHILVVFIYCILLAFKYKETIFKIFKKFKLRRIKND